MHRPRSKVYAGAAAPEMAGTPRVDLVEEAHRLLAAAAERDVRLRLIGGLAFALHVGKPHPAFARAYKDIDVATVPSDSGAAATVITSLGYAPEREFNALNGHRRLLFFDARNERRLDVFVGEFSMCHTIPITARLALDPVSIPLAELLLTKLQIVELNDRDLRDIAALLLEHEVSCDDADAINGARVAQLCAADWGLWRTCTTSLECTRTSIADYPLTKDEIAVIVSRIDALQAVISYEPKPRRFTLRGRIGDRKRWYELPEEVD